MELVKVGSKTYAQSGLLITHSIMLNTSISIRM